MPFAIIPVFTKCLLITTMSLSCSLHPRLQLTCWGKIRNDCHHGETPRAIIFRLGRMFPRTVGLNGVRGGRVCPRGPKIHPYSIRITFLKQRTWLLRKNCTMQVSDLGTEGFRDGWRYQIGWIFGKVPKGGGIIFIFNPKTYIEYFGPLYRFFSDVFRKKLQCNFPKIRGGGIEGQLEFFQKFIRFGSAIRPL